MSQIRISSSVKQIGPKAFCQCSSLTNIDIPSSVTIIDHHAFSKSNSLIQIKILSFTTIEQSAFIDCTALEHAELLCSITSINEETF